MALPQNGTPLKKIFVTDPLHVAAIDLIFTELAPLDMVNIQGIEMKNGRWILINGTHNLNYGTDDNDIPCYIHANRDNNMFTIDFFGNEPTKTIEKIIGAKRIKVVNESFIREIDMFVMKEKEMEEKGGYTMDIVRIPMNNVYTFRKHGEKGYMILHKENVDNKQSYTIDVVDTYYNKIISAILNGNVDRIRVIVCCIVSENIFVRTMDKTAPELIFPCQQVIVDYVINEYSKKNKNVTVLVSGPPGMGKSTVALWVAQMMKRRLAVDPYLVKGFNTNCDEMQYHPIINHYSPKNISPVILLLDEFDIAMKNANSADTSDGTKNAVAISANKTNLNNFLDSINDEQFLITIATTNMKLDDINKEFNIYCRKGRFNKHFEIISHDNVRIADPN